ncbi:hypothetical protein BH10BAC4_BH10BAC4_17720 [soil metagenome]
MKITSLTVPIFICLVTMAGCGKRSESENKEKSAYTSKEESRTKDPLDSLKKKEKKTTLSAIEADFLLKAVDSRLMGRLEGKAAIQKSTSKDVKDYGALMVKDQTTMLVDLREIAKVFSLPLPDTISEAKQDGFEDLLEKDVKKFDKKFIKMMRIDHRRDARLFSRAKDFENKKIKAFATQYLPLVESHLEKIKVLKKKEQEKNSKKK